MATVHPASALIEILPPPVGSIEERERRLIEAVVALARSLRDERDRLAARLREVEFELSRLTSKLGAHGASSFQARGASHVEARGASSFEARGDEAEAIDAFSDPETGLRAVRPRRPSRTSA